MVRFHLYTWWNLAYLNQTFCMGAPCTCMVWKGLLAGAVLHWGYKLILPFCMLNKLYNLQQNQPS
jgi:hypothetical protein